jgi:hypothetical protein
MSESQNRGEVLISGVGIRSENHWRALTVITINRYTNEGLQKLPVAGTFSTQEEAISAGIKAGISEINRLFPALA